MHTKCSFICQLFARGQDGSCGDEETLPGGANGFFQADAGHNAPSVGCFAVASFRLCNYLRFGLLDVFCGHPCWRGQ